MDSTAVLDLFRTAGALLEGHFRLSSGLHSAGYLQCALVLQDPRLAEALGTALGERARAAAPNVVLSPALGGVIIGHEVARTLGIRAIFAERQDATLTLRRGFSLGASDRVLVVEDVVTTGKSTLETMQVARHSGAQVVGAAAVINRGGAASLGVPTWVLASVSMPTYDRASCPLCAEGRPIVKPGSRPA